MRNMFERLPNETELDYHKRLVYGKLVDKTLSDIDYAELAPYIYGREFATDECRKRMYGSCQTLKLMDEAGVFGSVLDTTVDFDAQRFELQKERQRFFDQRTALNKLVRERARQEELNDILIRAINGANMPEIGGGHGCPPESDNDLLVSLNDIHYGASYDNYWGKYNSDICAEMMGRYADRVIQIAKTHKSENCVVWQNGDAISGSIHKSIQVANKENIIDQIKGVSELISQFLARLSDHFKTVSYISVSGNHSRIDSKDDALMSERLDNLVEWYLGARLQNISNIVLGVGDRIDETMYCINVRGKNYVGVHGDYDPAVQQIQTLQTMVERPVYAVLTGHKHHNETNCVQGVRTIMAGSFLGMDDYAISKRLYGKPEQMVCVCDKDGVRCHYDIEL